MKALEKRLLPNPVQNVCELSRVYGESEYQDCAV